MEFRGKGSVIRLANRLLQYGSPLNLLWFAPGTMTARAIESDFVGELVEVARLPVPPVAFLNLPREGIE